MLRARPFYYLVDRLDSRSVAPLRLALKTVADIEEVIVHLAAGVLEVRAFRDVEAEVRFACEVAGTALRTRLRRFP